MIRPINYWPPDKFRYKIPPIRLHRVGPIQRPKRMVQLLHHSPTTMRMMWHGNHCNRNRSDRPMPSMPLKTFILTIVVPAIPRPRRRRPPPRMTWRNTIPHRNHIIRLGPGNPILPIFPKWVVWRTHHSLIRWIIYLYRPITMRMIHTIIIIVLPSKMCCHCHIAMRWWSMDHIPMRWNHRIMSWLRPI